MTQGAAAGHSTSTLIKIMAAVRDLSSLPNTLRYPTSCQMSWSSHLQKAEVVRMPRPGIGNSRVRALLVFYLITHATDT